MCEASYEFFHDQGLYGLRAGIDPDNVLEFVSEYPLPSHVTCRSVQNGMATETTVAIGSDIYLQNAYRIEATTAVARFFVNGNQVCTHATNIPVDVALGRYYSRFSSKTAWPGSIHCRHA